MNEQKKIFEDFPTVDCNECESYYLNQCDGVVRGSERLCTAFIATRRVNIPQQIKWLKTRLKWLVVALSVAATWLLILTWWIF